MIKYLGVIGIVLMIVEYATPIQWIKAHYKLTHADPDPKHLGKRILKDVLNCAKCLGFWVGLVFYQDLYWAVIVSFGAEITYRLYNKLTTLI